MDLHVNLLFIKIFLFFNIIREMNSSNSKYILYIFTILIIGVFIFFYFIKKNNKVKPLDTDIINNEKLKKSDQLKLKVHSIHHSNENLKKISNKLIEGETWEKAHKSIPKSKFWNHIIHIDNEMYNLVMKSIFVTFGFLGFQVIFHAIKYVSPKEKGLELWFLTLCFLLLLILFSIFSMYLKHQLSFSTNNPDINNLIL